MEAQTWLDSYQQRITAIGQRAERAQESLRTTDSTVLSRDGAVTVTVAPGGALRSLVLHQPAEAMSRTRLAETIMAAVATGHAAAARAAADALTPLLGERSAGMDFVRSQLPPMPAEQWR